MRCERRIKGRFPRCDIPSDKVAVLAGSIGGGAFVPTLLRFADLVGGAQFVSVFCQGDRDDPLLVGTACSAGQNRAELAARGYQTHFRSDRNAQILMGEAGPGDFLTIQHAEDIESFTYRRDCYDLPRIADRVSLIRRRQDYALAVSLYRGCEVGAFADDDHDRVAALLHAMLALTERHIAFTLRDTVWKGQDIQTRLALTYPHLTDREREVAAMTIKGRTASEIAEILGVAETTVISHRKKAYRRMNVRSLRELMAR